MASRSRRPSLKKPPVLFERSQKLIARLEAELDAPLVTYWNSPSGSVCDNDVRVLYELMRNKREKTDRLAFFIKSDGGNGQASLRIINLLRQNTKKLEAYVPLDCASAATMMALGADKIHMGPLAYLTAVDTSITHELSPADIDNNLVSVSQDELTRVVRLWGKNRTERDDNPYQSLFAHVHPLVIGAVDRSSSLSIRLCTEILSYHMKEKGKADKISRHLNADYPSHSYPITLKEAVRIGLPAVAMPVEINDTLLELNEVYSEMGQKAVTDFDEANYHNNEVGNIIETRDTMVYFQVDKDWHYRKEERRWVPMNDQSTWHKIEKPKRGKTPKHSIFHTR